MGLPHTSIKSHVNVKSPLQPINLLRGQAGEAKHPNLQFGNFLAKCLKLNAKISVPFSLSQIL
jgi:hypothetical protein